MKFIMTIILATVMLYSCGSGNDKKVTDTASPNSDASPVDTGLDAELTTWLKGKVLKSDDPSKDYNDFRLYADGTCMDKGNAKAEWAIKNGELVIHSAIDMKFKLEKKDETTLVLHRNLSDETYKIEPIH